MKPTRPTIKTAQYTRRSWHVVVAVQLCEATHQCAESFAAWSTHMAGLCPLLALPSAVEAA